jgi:hypothetical protein
MNTTVQSGPDMRSIYIRSLLFAFGLAGFLALELLLPRSVDAALPRTAPVGAAHAPA